MGNIKYHNFQDTIDKSRSIVDNLSRDTFSFPAVPALQKKSIEDEEVQLKPVTQLAGSEEEELQMKSVEPLKNSVAGVVSQRKDNTAVPGTNRTGVPGQLKTGIENLSGFSMDDVKVHYNSGKPAQLNALAYAQGTDIHIAPGQEKHLPHEAWHVVQQKQGRVKPTMQMKGGVNVNDDKGLEKEADVMGGMALNRIQQMFQRKVSNVYVEKDFPNLNYSVRQVAQLVNYPEDSIGSINKRMAQIEGEGGIRYLTGSELQNHILEKAREAGEEGGYRLGSYIYDESKKLNRKMGEDDEEHGMPQLPSGFKVDDLDPWIKVFIIGTLTDAGQIGYIDENAGEIFKTHQVVIDVDCQFDRRGNVGFHKDSRGTTAFVNLTFNNEEEMQGADHYEDVAGDPGLEKKLPEVVQGDIKARREGYKGYKGIKSPVLPAKGRLSFSDPNLYHSTPLMGNRLKPTGKESRSELINKLTGLIDESELNKTEDKILREWYQTYVNAYNLHGFEKLSEVADKSYEKAYHAARNERRLSKKLNKGKISQETLDKQQEKPRTFIRTWVRFVPK